MHCNTLQHTATHCATLKKHIATHCTTLKKHTWLSGPLVVLQHTATHYNTLQHTATHYNALQHTATHCNTLQYTAETYIAVGAAGKDQRIERVLNGLGFSRDDHNRSCTEFSGGWQVCVCVG